MKKRTAFIGVILSLSSFGQPLLIKTGVVLSTTGLIISFPEKIIGQNLRSKIEKFYFDRAFKKGENGDYSGAIADYTRLIQLNPYDVEAYYNRGVNKGRNGDYSGAIADYTKAIQFNPNSNEEFILIAYWNRSIIKEKHGEILGACLDAKKAISLGYKDNLIENFKTKLWLRNNCD